MGRRAVTWIALVAALIFGAAPAAVDARPFQVTETREPCAAHSPLRSPFFGDLHVHTRFSQDASTQGTRNGPREVYRFARGEALGIQPYDDQGRAKRSLKLDRPLDFAAVTDHAELIGEVEICRTPGALGYESWTCWVYREFPRAAYFIMNTKSSMRDPTRFGFCGEGGRLCLAAARVPWQEIQDAAEGAYDRTSACRFTSFVGYEWTGSVDTNNLHRNVIFRNEHVPELPTSFYEASSAEALWKALRDGCLERGDGCDLIAIPHNSNLSNGLIFQTVGPEGRPITTEEARTRAELERLVEVMQHKGSSAAYSPTDRRLCASRIFLCELPPKFCATSRRCRGRGFSAIARAGLAEGTPRVNPFKFG